MTLKIAQRALAVTVSVLLIACVLWSSGSEKVIAQLVRFPSWVLAAILGGFAANLFVVSLRMWRIFGTVRIALSWQAASRASLAGHVAGLMMVSLLGQAMGRQAVLQQCGVKPAVIASLTAYERAVVMLVGAALGLAGAILLSGQAAVLDFLKRLSLAEVGIVAASAIALSLMSGPSRLMSRLRENIRSVPVLAHVWEIGGLTLVSQALMLSAFVVGIHAIAPDIPSHLAYAAAAVVSFAASIPVSVNGWGVREAAAAYVLGHLGVEVADAIALSVLVGLCSTAVILAAAPWAFKKPARQDAPQVAAPSDMVTSVDLEKVGVWVFGMATAVLIWFQLHIELPGFPLPLNFNLADPFAILALAVVASHAMFDHQVPRWRVPQFNSVLVVFSVALLAAFAIGVMQIGVTRWALTGRLFGWLVLLGYLSAPYLIARHLGAHGLRRFGETMVATGVVVVTVTVAARLLEVGGWNPGFKITQNFEGYSGNRNAFAFQLLVGIALVFAYSSLRTRWASRSLDSLQWERFAGSAVLLGILFAGLILTSSRAGWLAGVLMLFVAWIGRFAERQVIMRGVVLGTAFYGMIAMAALGVGGHGSMLLVQSGLSGEISNHERWATIIHGLDMWRNAPLLGAGLGVFVEQSAAIIGKATVIHSTPVWILAEFGLTGVAIFGWGLFVVARYAWIRGVTAPMRRLLAVLLAGFCAFFLAHEIFYQRILWVALGAALAYPGERTG